MWTWRCFYDKLIGTHMLPKGNHQLGSIYYYYYYYFHCYNYCQNHETLKLSGWSLVREKQSTLVFALWTWNYFSTFSSYLSNSFQKMKHLFQGETEASWRKINKLFRIVLSFSVHSPDPFFSSASFPYFNLSYSFLSFHPQCFFSLGVSSSNLSEELSII